MNQLTHFLKLASLCTVALGLVACAKLEDRARGYLASSVDVFAVLDGQLLQGQAQLQGDRSGTLSITTGLSVVPVLACSGRLSRTGTTTALLQLQCNNGNSLSLSAAMLADTQGYAYGPSSDGQTASLTLGLTPTRAVTYLRAPVGRQLIALSKKPFIELR